MDEVKERAKLVDDLVEAARSLGYWETLRSTSQETIDYWTKRLADLKAQLSPSAVEEPSPTMTHHTYRTMEAKHGCCFMFRTQRCNQGPDHVWHKYPTPTDPVAELEEGGQSVAPEGRHEEWCDCVTWTDEEREPCDLECPDCTCRQSIAVCAECGWSNGYGHDSTCEQSAGAAAPLEDEVLETLKWVINDVAEWCDAVDADSSWDSWDEYFKSFFYGGLDKARAVIAKVGAAAPSDDKEEIAQLETHIRAMQGGLAECSRLFDIYEVRVASLTQQVEQTREERNKLTLQLEALLVAIDAAGVKLDWYEDHTATYTIRNERAEKAEAERDLLKELVREFVEISSSHVYCDVVMEGPQYRVREQIKMANRLHSLEQKAQADILAPSDKGDAE